MSFFAFLITASVAFGQITHQGYFTTGGGEQTSTSYSGSTVGEASGGGEQTSSNYEAAGGTSVQVLSQQGLGGFLLSAAQVVAKWLFFNNTRFDGDNPAANADDDNAIAIGKKALRPGFKAKFENFTSFHKGINGVMVDIDGLPGTPTAADFDFRLGNDSTPGSWNPAAVPQAIAVREGAGKDGSDRVTIIWADDAIKKAWLCIRVKATEVTGLANPHVFYFGNAVGKSRPINEADPEDADASVGAQDELRARANPRGFFNQAAVDNYYDYNRDGFVNATDQLIARANVTSFFTKLELIEPADE